MATSYDGGVKAESSSDFIKADPDRDTNQTNLEDDGAFEDTNELELPQQLQEAWLVRLPPNLHEKWTAMEAGEEMVVGTLRRYKKSGKQQIMLNRSLPMYDKVAKSFDMDKTEEDVTNTYVFSEKDLPGFHKGAKNKKGGPDATNGRVDKNGRYNFRRAVPKQTALRYLITSEFNCMATENAETAELMRERVQAAEHVRPRVEFLTMDPRQSEGMSQNTGGASAFGNFVVSRRQDEAAMQLFANSSLMKASASNKARPQENKAARMPRNELLDRLFACFKEYTFWSMKALRERLHQPESYLKDTLEDIAELIRSGQQTGNWRLKPEAMQDNFKDDGGGEESNPDEDLLDSDDDTKAND